MKSGFKVMDSDIHIVEPPDLWQRYVAPEFKDRAPYGLAESVGDMSLFGPDGVLWGPRMTGSEEKTRMSGEQYSKNRMRYKPYDDRGWTGEVELDGMDAEGIDVAVVYPSRGIYILSNPGMDPRLAAALARAYNDWLYDFCQADPTRLIGAGMISPFDVEDAVSEAHRCVKDLGFKGVFLRPNQINNRNWHDPYYGPLWSALEELGVPIGFHEGSGSALPQVGKQFGENYMLRHIFCHPVEQMMAAASFCAGGVLQRHPNLRAAFLEGNCSWLPFLLWRMDDHWEREGDTYAPDLKIAPSTYFKQQCFASVEADEEPAKYAIDFMGNDRLIFSTDFPHEDSKFPHSVESFLTLPITDEDKRKILWDNCAQLYAIKG